MMLRFEFVCEASELRELLFGSPIDSLEQMMSGLKAKVENLHQAPEINQSGQVENGHHRMMAAEPTPAPTPVAPFDLAAATKTLTDARNSMLAQRDIVKKDNDVLTADTNAFEKAVKAAGVGLKMKVGEEKYLTTTIGTETYVVKLTQPTAGVYGCQFIKQG